VPRPKRKTASPHFHTWGRKIAPESVPRLEALLGAPVEGLVLLDVETALGMAIEGAKHLDHIPRPADYVNEFRKVGRDAFTLLNELAEWSYYYTDQFALRGANVHEIESNIARLVDVCTAVVNEFEGKPSKGAPKGAALRQAVFMLAEVFDKKHTGNRALKARRSDFVLEALIGGRAVPAGFGGVPAILRALEKAI
jgi:hypothetical protein